MGLGRFGLEYLGICSSVSPSPFHIRDFHLFDSCGKLCVFLSLIPFGAKKPKNSDSRAVPCKLEGLHPLRGIRQRFLSLPGGGAAWAPEKALKVSWKVTSFSRLSVRLPLMPSHRPLRAWGWFWAPDCTQRWMPFFSFDFF